MHRILITILAIALAAGSSRAGTENAGTTAGNFLSVGSGASVLSMGGATLGLGDDLHAAAWNPAALAHVDATAFAISHAALAEQSTQDHLAVGGRFGHGATRWAATLLRQGDGSFDGRDASNISTGSFNVSSMAAGLQFARPIGGAMSAGVGASWLGDNLGDTQGTGFALDFGLQAHAGPVGLGLAARNVGGSMSYPSGRYDLPSVYGVGAAWSDAAHGLRLALDANFPHAYYNDVRFGGEWRWQEHVALRAGYRMELAAAAGEPLGGPSFGLGVGANGVWMDYAFLSGNADAQGRHRLGLTFHPGVLGTSMRHVADAQGGQAATAEREAVAVAAPRPASPAPASAPPASAAPASASAPVTVAATPLVAPAAATAPAGVAATPIVTAAPVAAPHTASVAMTRALAPVAVAAALPTSVLEIARRLPPGASESEARRREGVPSAALVASRPVRVRPLDLSKPTGSIGDTWVDPQAVAVVAPVASAPSAPTKPTVPAVVIAPPAVVAPPVASTPPAAERPAAPAAVAPVVVAPPVAVVAPVASPPLAPAASSPAVMIAPPVVVAAPVASSPSATVATRAPRALRSRHAGTAAQPATPASAAPVTAGPSAEPSVAPSVAPSIAPSIAPSVPQVIPVPPVASPEVVPAVTAPAPQAAPAAPQAAPEPEKPAKTSPWPTVSATIPSVQLATSAPRVTVVTLPPGAPSTAPITRSPAASPTPRPSFVFVAEGETLEMLAKRWDTTVPAIMMENNLVNLTLKRGRKLVLPPPQHR